MTSTAKKKLIPPDLERCQAEIRSGSFMTIGPRPMERCTNAPVVVAEETTPSPSDGLCGAMSLCESCRAVCEKKIPTGLRYVDLAEWKERTP